MGKKLENVAAEQRDMLEKSKFKVQQYITDIDIREEKIQKLEKEAEQRRDDIKMYELKLYQAEEREKDISEELELKSGENNRLRNQVADLEKAVQDLYGSRKGEGSLHVELNNLKADNEKLIALLKESSEYQDLEDIDIMRKAKYLSNQSVAQICDTFGIELNKAQTRMLKRQGDANEWIPTAAVKKIEEIKKENEKDGGLMTETCISRILYELNMIWRNIMRKENQAIKKKFTLQVQDLRR